MSFKEKFLKFLEDNGVKEVIFEQDGEWIEFNGQNESGHFSETIYQIELMGPL